MDKQMEFLPILQDFLPCRGRCPATLCDFTTSKKQGKGTADPMMPFGVLFCTSVQPSTPPGWPSDPTGGPSDSSCWPLDPSSRPSDPTSLKQQLEGFEGLLDGSKGQQEGSKGLHEGLRASWRGLRANWKGLQATYQDLRASHWGMDGWMDKQIYRQTDFLPILQDFVPCQGRWPKRKKELEREGYCTTKNQCYFRHI